MTMQQIDSDKQLLRDIATKIIAQPNVYDTIKLKLRTYHTTDAKTVWSQYNKATLPKAVDQNYGTHVTIGNLSTTARGDILSLVGKTSNTFYTPQEINTIQDHVQTAVQNGTIKVDERDSNAISVDYNVNLGEICTKNAQPPLNAQCNPKTTIRIVLVADQFFNDIKQHGSSAWKAKVLNGSIQNIY